MFYIVIIYKKSVEGKFRRRTIKFNNLIGFLVSFYLRCDNMIVIYRSVMAKSAFDCKIPLPTDQLFSN